MRNVSDFGDDLRKKLNWMRELSINKESVKTDV